jgi:hypothetical protein
MDTNIQSLSVNHGKSEVRWKSKNHKSQSQCPKLMEQLALAIFKF